LLDKAKRGLLFMERPGNSIELTKKDKTEGIQQLVFLMIVHILNRPRIRNSSSIDIRTNRYKHDMNRLNEVCDFSAEKFSPNIMLQDSGRHLNIRQCFLRYFKKPNTKTVIVF